MQDRIQEQLHDFVDCIVVQTGKEALAVLDQKPIDMLLVGTKLRDINCTDFIYKVQQKVDHPMKYLLYGGVDDAVLLHRALQLGVDDVIDAHGEDWQLISKIHDCLVDLEDEQMTQQAVASLLSRLKKTRKFLEQQAINAMMSNLDPDLLKQYVELLPYPMKSAVCFTVKNVDTSVLEHIKTSLDEIGYCMLYKAEDHYSIMMILFHEVMTYENIKNIKFTIMFKAQKNLKIGMSGIAKEYCELYQHYLMSLKDYDCTKGEVLIERLGLIDDFVDNLIKMFAADDIATVTWKVHDLLRWIWKHDQAFLDVYIRYFFDGLIEQLRTRSPEIAFGGDLLWNSEGLATFSDIEKQFLFILDRIYETFVSERKQKDNQLVVKALQYIKNNYNSALTLDDLSNHLKVSSGYLSHMLTKSYGKKFTEIVSDMRIEAAKKLLRKDIYVKEVCYKVGFQNPSYFNKVFKDHVNITPTEYQKKYSFN